MAVPAWAYGAAGGGAIGYFAFGDSPGEVALGMALGTPAGSKAFQTIATRAGQGILSGLGWAAKTPTAQRMFAGSRLAIGGVGYAIIAGAGISYAIAGKTGMRDYSHHLAHSMDPGYWTGDWWNTVTLKSMR